MVPSEAYADILNAALLERGIEDARILLATGDDCTTRLAELAQAPSRAVALIIERFGDGRAFVEVAQAAICPVVVLVLPRETAGGEPEESPSAIGAALRKARALRAASLEELADAVVCLAANLHKLPSSADATLVAPEALRPWLLATGQAEGLSLTASDDVLPSAAPEAGAPAATPHLEAGALRALPGLGGIILVQAGAAAAGLADGLAGVASTLPVAACFADPVQRRAARDAGWPVFPTPERALRAYRALVSVGRGPLDRAAGEVVEPANPVQPMAIEGTGVMDEHEAKRLLDRWGVTVVPETLVIGPGRHEFTPVRKLATHFGFPVALKAIRRDIVDKVGMGAVASNVQTVEELEAAWERLHAAFPDAAWLVQPMLPGDIELIVGARRDPTFGPLVQIGPGGVMTELYDDVATRLAPLTEADALAMIGETTVHTLLAGFRGLPFHDPREVAQVLVRVGDLMLGQPSVEELAINPLLLTEKGPIVMDALAVIR